MAGSFHLINLLPGLTALTISIAPIRSAEESSSTKTAQQIMESARDSIVVIRQTGRDGGTGGIGTGFVISRDGLIATCLHVIGEARPLRVSFANGQTAAVTEIHAWDRKLDLAILRVDAKDLQPLRLADSDLLRQGAPVVAIGNPQGLAHSIVQGVVSAIRDFEFGPMIQLAIPIEPGNSGGPLLDMRGRVQGILNIKSLITENLGFAIPINAIKPLLEKPNSVPMEKWLAIGALNSALWQPIMGAQWRQRTGLITVEDAGRGFGGRALCLSKQEVPDLPYEIAVTVLLDDEAGAAGLAFASDEADLHYGFYPSGGQLRLTRFDGPSVYTWNILRQIDSPHYRPGEWNRLKVRLEPEKILCFVNDQLVAEVDEKLAREGKAGLAKFRNTKAKFKNFQLAKSIPSDPQPAENKVLTKQIESALEKPDASSRELLDKPTEARALLLARARDLDQQAATARKLAADLNQKSVQQEMVRIFRRDEPDINLFSAALLIGRLETPDLDLDSYRDELTNIVVEIRSRLPDNATAREKIDHLRKYLFEDNGYHGSRSDYYNRANSFLNRVIDDREGIPITLSVLFLELGRKLGIEKLEGMPFPGHFMVRFTEPNKDSIYIDVFDGGKTYQKSQLYSLIANHSEVPLLDEHFKPATKRDIILRILKNLIAVSLQQDDPTRTLPYLDLSLAVSPDQPIDRFRRATLLLQTGQRSLAREDLKWLLDHKPAGFDLDRIEDLYRKLQ